MTLIKKILSVSLLCFLIVFSHCVTSMADDTASLTKLLELDLSGFVSSTAEGSGGIVNIGESTTADINAFNTSSARVDVDTVTGTNGEETEYLRVTHNYYNWNMVGTRLFISDLAWENEDVTFSFWADLGTENENAAFPARCIMDYTMKFDDNGTEILKKAAIYQIDFEGNNLYRWNFPGYNMDSPMDLSGERGWNHVAIINRQPDAAGNKVMDIYINGTYRKSATIAIPSEAELQSATIYFGRAENQTYAATDMKLGNFEVYSGILSADDILNIYGTNRGKFGVEAPNTVISSPDIIEPDAQDIQIMMKNPIAPEELSEISFYRLDGEPVEAVITFEDDILTVTPMQYLVYDAEYIIDFPKMYCDDVNVETVSQKIEAVPSASGDRIDFELARTDDNQWNLSIIAVGYDADGKLLGAVSKDITVSENSVSDYITDERISDWDQIKFMIWNKASGFTEPLMEVIEIQ